ncbi:MAG: hypothetical protein EBZ78_06965 [Verrucomicrobia bacterium]|nr:hypothetical protein [Verrucomicrobiota bacterium]
MKRIFLPAVCLGLLGILLWVMDPSWISTEKEKSGGIMDSPAHKNQKASRKVLATTPPHMDGEKKEISNLGEMDTGAGRAIPGEKILKLKDRAAYQRFLASAPAGAILGKIDSLLAVRVQDGEWLKSYPASEFGSAGKNYYVESPQVPLNLMTAGNAQYKEVGAKSMDLMGAEAVTAGWGKGVKVALLDTAIEGAEILQGAEAGHGTAMLSLITGSSGRVQGAGPGATILSFPVLGGDGVGDSFSLAMAIMNAVDQGAQVINMSLGSDGDSWVVREAVNYALSKNVALVAAAGNEAVNRVSYPAAYDGVLSVGSVDANGQHLFFSNRGPSVDVVAPGLAVLADWPGGKMVEVSGTSASTALVSGVVAALLSKEPGLTGKRATELIQQYADDTAGVGKDDETGYGVVDLQRVLQRNQRGVIDLAIAGVKMTTSGDMGQITVSVQNRGTETVNSPTLEITVGGSSRKFFPGSIAPGQSIAESVQFDLVRAKKEEGVAARAEVYAPRGTDERTDNNYWPKDGGTAWFKISN